jgi:hypothetical protein
MSLTSVYGAGLRNGYIRTSDGVVHDIDAVINIEGDPKQDDTEIPGDDTIKATFSSGRKEDITITANAVTLDVIQSITGNSISSSASGAEVALGTQSELNPVFVEVGGEVNGRSSDGTTAAVRKVWHRVQLGQTKVNWGNGNELSVEITGTAYPATAGITGTSLATERVATLYVANGSVS